MKTLVKLGAFIIIMVLIYTCDRGDNYGTTHNHCTTHNKTYAISDGCPSCNAGW